MGMLTKLLRFFVVGFRIMPITFEPTSPSQPNQFYPGEENVTLINT